MFEFENEKPVYANYEQVIRFRESHLPECIHYKLVAVLKKQQLFLANFRKQMISL